MGNRTKRVFFFQMNLARTNQRILLIFTLTVAFVFSNLRGVVDFSGDVGVPVTPWAFPHITSDYICQMVIMAGAVGLFCDAPFHSEIQRYILPRAGYAAWTAGQCLYIMALSGLYLLAILLATVLPLLTNLDLQAGWGKIWGTLARTAMGTQYGIPFSVNDYVIGAYTPLQAMGLSFLLSWCCCIWLGLLTYLLNSLSGGYIGTFVAAGFVLMDITVANEWAAWFYKLSPVTLSQLQALSGVTRIYRLTLGYALWFFGISIVCLFAACMAVPKIQSLRREQK